MALFRDCPSQIAATVEMIAIAVVSVAARAFSAASAGLRLHHRQSRSDAARAPRQDRPVVEEPAQVFGQRPGRRVAVGGVLGHRLQDDRLQVAGDLAVNRSRRRRVVVQDAIASGAARSPSSNAGRRVSSS